MSVVWDCNAGARWNTVDPVYLDSAAPASFDDGRSRGRVSLKNIAVRLLLHFDLPKASDHSCHTEMATQMFPKTAKKHCWLPQFSAIATVLVQVPTMMRHTRITLHPARSSAAVKGSDSQAAYRTLARTLFRFANEPFEKRGLSDSVWRRCRVSDPREQFRRACREALRARRSLSHTLPLGRPVAC